MNYSGNCLGKLIEYKKLHDVRLFISCLGESIHTNIQIRT
ncbi:MAG: hypothetical protein BMS9Abin36_0625 [Gammaproteobacteria bacterium]|nr:MAG: hypothetical protein BMS9Abin36_0625 [Gammaproteobacteria bacterium]